MRIHPLRQIRRGFTLIELLVVIGIIAILVSILLPVVSQVRLRAYIVATQGEMQRIATACQLYYNTFHAYPGPLADPVPPTSNLPGTLNNTGITNAPRITSSENLILGL